jgi:hypothetical protein
MEHGNLYIPDFNDPKVATYGLKGAAESTGTISTYAVALHDIGTNKCIGTIGIDYLKKNKLSKKELSLLNQRAERIGGYLSNFLN